MHKTLTGAPFGRCLVTLFGPMAAVVALIAAASPAVHAQTLRSRGTIDQIDGQNIGIKTPDGYRIFYKVVPYTLVSTLRSIAPSAIAKGQTVRVAVGEERPGSVFVVAAAQVFPATDTTIGASRFLWDMTSLGSVVDVTFDRIMEAEPVPEGQRQVPGVRARATVYGRPVTLLFPPNCPVTTFVPGNRTGLQVGTPIFVYGEMSGDHPIEVALTDPNNLAPKN